MMRKQGRRSSISLAMEVLDGFAGKAKNCKDRFFTAGDIAISFQCERQPTFIWGKKRIYGVIIESELCSVEAPVWEIHSMRGISSPLTFGALPDSATEESPLVTLIPGNHYFVSVYGEYPSYGIQEFVL